MTDEPGRHAVTCHVEGSPLRHEALLYYRMEVEDRPWLGRRSGLVKLEAQSKPRVAGEDGSSLDKVASVQRCRMGRVR
jgi:hypothetical protein